VVPRARRDILALLVIALLAAGASAAAAAPQHRIVGGTVPTQAWPAMAQVQIQEGAFAYECGGTLVAPIWVLTAAHCMTTAWDLATTPQAVMVSLGSTRLDRAGGTQYGVSQVLRHPRWNSSTGGYDAALLHLTTAAPQSPMALIAPSELSLQAPGMRARVLGWGHTSENGVLSPDLQQVDVPIQGDTDCDDANSYGGRLVRATMICAGYAQGGKDACQGDSGGPLMVDTGQRPSAEPADGWRLIGIVSSGEGCARPNKYGIYTELANTTIRSWIYGQAGIAAPPSPPSPPPAPLPPAPRAKPAAAFKYSGTRRAKQPMTFTSKSTHPDGVWHIVAFDWDLNNDGVYNDASGSQVKWTYATTGTKHVRLRVTDDDGDTSTAVRTVDIKKKK
jgi:trypsin